MAFVYVLAHFDDEYGAWPLIRSRALQRLDQWFFYVADYATPDRSARRLAESRAALASLGIDPQRVIHIGAGTGLMDGAIHRHLSIAWNTLRAAVKSLAQVERLTTLAWEGGHMDHDMCALLASELAAELGGAPVEQFSLYNGAGLPRPLFRASSPLPQNGPVERMALNGADWCSWMAAVRFYRSQARTWAGLWPMMFLGRIGGGGFAIQGLAPERPRERPHRGPLLYEGMFKVAYEDVRAAADAFLSRAPGLA